MYVPTHFEETDLAVLQALIQAHPLGAWVTLGTGDAGLLANHIPFLLDPHPGEFGTLSAHVAKANPVWRTFSSAQDSVVIFQGSEAYISPSWYPSKQAHGKVVPTWNYAVVHAHGVPRVVDDPRWLMAHLAALTDAQEGQLAAPWKVSDAPEEYTQRLAENIVGIEIPISKLVGKWKVSQNRPDPDKRGVVSGLLARNAPGAADMAGWVGRHVRPESTPES